MYNHFELYYKIMHMYPGATYMYIQVIHYCW